MQGKRMMKHVICLLLAASACLAAVVKIPPGEGSAQDIIDANPEGTTYYLAPGIHRYFSISPKSYDTYIGQSGSVLTGGRLLPDWQYDTSSGLYYVTNQTQQNEPRGTCDPNRNCMPPEDLFMDEVPLIHVMDVTSVVSGTYFFDFNAHIIYMADNPAGHTMETSVSSYAFFNYTANNVTIMNMYVEKYAIGAQFGAIGGSGPGAGWVVANCTVTQCHGTGIMLNTYGQMLYNNASFNGQKGVGAHGDYVLVEGNIIAFNNYAGFDVGWEAGGSKFAETSHLTVKNNWCYNNTGPGLWNDIDNIYAVYDGNVVEYNQGTGILHEISYSSIFRNNYARFNGLGSNQQYRNLWFGGHGIHLQNSGDCDVYNNTVIVSEGNGIAIYYQNRGNGTYGPWTGVNNYISNNRIYYTNWNLGQSGAVCGWAAPDLNQFWGSLIFDYNEYYAPNDANWWYWYNEIGTTWSQFQNGEGATPQEPHGTYSIGNFVIPEPPALNLVYPGSAPSMPGTPTEAPIAPTTAPTPSPTAAPSPAPSTDTVCVGPIGENQAFTISCPHPDEVITSVPFASYGTASGSCGSFNKGSCDASDSSSVFSGKCLNQNSCSFTVGNDAFGDPCVGTPKHFVAQAVCGPNVDKSPNHATQMASQLIAVLGLVVLGIILQ